MKIEDIEFGKTYYWESGGSTPAWFVVLGISYKEPAYDGDSMEGSYPFGVWLPIDGVYYADESMKRRVPWVNAGYLYELPPNLHRDDLERWLEA